MSDMLLGRIDQARRSLRGNRLLVGFLQVVAVLIAAVAGFFIIDWLAINRILPLGWGNTISRAVLLIATLAAIGRVVWTSFLSEWRIQRDDDAIALKVEDHHRVLGGRLISTVQLTRALDEQGNEGLSADMIEGLVEQTEAAAGDLDFLGIIDRKLLKRAALIAAGALLVAGGLSAWRPDFALALLKRLALMPVDYPTATRIIAVNHEGRVPQGEAYPIEIELDPQRFIPEVAEAQVKFATGTKVTVSLSKVATQPSGKVLFRGQVTQALDDFSFRPIANDARWPRWEPVEAVRRPAVGGLTVTCTYPAYLAMEPSTATVGDLRVPEGTVVAVKATTTKAIVKAFLVQRFGDAEPVEGPAEISTDTTSAVSGTFTVTASGTWSLRLEDKDGLSPALPPVYTITAMADKAPVITLVAPSQDKRASPRARWPLRFNVKDDYGLTTAQLKYQVEAVDAAPGATETPITAVDLPGLAKPGETVVDTAVEFKLSELDLQPGMRVTWWIEVADNRSPQANLGASQRLHFSIVDEETLNAEKERQMMEELENARRLIKQQQERRDELREILKKSIDGK